MGKTAAQSAARALVPQPHGGALLTGGVPGNKGGTGRPTSEIRAAFAESLHTRRKVLEDIADSAESKDRDRIAAVDIIGKYGIGSARPEDEPNAASGEKGITIVFANVLVQKTP